MWKGLNSRFACSSAESDDPGLAGRTYAIPFGVVWEAALRLAGGGLQGWTVTRSDDVGGTIEGRVRSFFLFFPADIVISVSLDANAQTRVDLTAESRHRGGDLGVNAWRIRRFCAALDRAASAGPNQVLNVRIRGARAA